MVETYLSTRSNLRAVVLILDIRRQPSDYDLQMLDWLRSFDIQPILVVTKCDKLSRNERASQSKLIAQTLRVDKDELTFFSAISREGTDGVWTRIERLVANDPADVE
jgi:GTP-binding protein